MANQRSVFPWRRFLSVQRRSPADLHLQLNACLFKTCGYGTSLAFHYSPCRTLGGGDFSGGRQVSSLNRRLRIAVADDDPRIRDFFERALSLLGYQVVVLAADGEELVAGCRSSAPDIIITDMHMPRLSGAEAVRRIWQTRQVPAILITGLPDADAVGGQSAQQTPLYLVKPVPLMELRRAISLAAARRPSPGENR